MSIQLQDTRSSSGRASREQSSPNRRSQRSGPRTSTSTIGGGRFVIQKSRGGGSVNNNGLVSLSSRVSSEAAPLLGKLKESPR